MKPIKPRNNNWKDKYYSYLRNLKYGRTYYMAFAGVTDGIEFTLKKKKLIRCQWIDGTFTYERRTWLRRILNDAGCIHFMFEVEAVMNEGAE